jgi:hypothetical protein
MNKSGVWAAVLLLFCACSIFSLGSKDITERTVDQNESWQETFDITGKKTGKYNIVVTATDKGGNQSVEGPYNIYVDPESDLPVAGITNPLADMRVPGNLNIVGTCVDDDAVAKVELILDGDRENPKLASGKEFWSYYLDTSSLSEGSHSIEVYGTDINGLRGHSQKIVWNLDRRQPVTTVRNYGLGMLVSGKLELKGTVSDGNGIKSLSWSLDGGKSFQQTKLIENKKLKEWEFKIPLDTRTGKDGPAVCWFKAVDRMGTEGLYSFLYFIDNTTPDVKIISPAKNEVCNGKFSIAGYARDVIGVKKLTWSFCGQTGDFELIAGNPYWVKEVDTTGQKGKSAELIITAHDTAGNVRIVKQSVVLNQEADKPVVKIESPAVNGLVESRAGSVYLRGIASDDDGVASVSYALDGLSAQTLDVDGVFSIPLSPDTDLSAGKHTVTVKAADIYGVIGNPVTVSFTAKGPVPSFSAAVIRSSEGTMPFVSGLLVHPESNAFFETKLSSAGGIQSIRCHVKSGSTELPVRDISPKTPQKETIVSIPLSDLPWGLVQLGIEAVDVYGRVSTIQPVLHIKDLTKIYSDSAHVVFDDSQFNERGEVVIDPAYPVSGYFVGGTAKTVELVPKTSFAQVELSGNSIVLKAGSGTGVSSPVKVRVTNDQGIAYESRELIFKTDVPAPSLNVDGSSPDSPAIFDGFGSIRVSGKIDSPVPVTSAGYRILSAGAVMAGDIVTGVNPSVVMSEIYPVSVDSSGKYSFSVDSTAFGTGMSVIEIIAENGKKSAAAVFVKKIPALPVTSPDGKKVIPLKPVITWFEDVDVYFAVTYQGTVDHPCGVFLRNSLAAGDPEVSAVIKDESNKVFSAKYVTKKTAAIKVRFDRVAGSSYMSGMPVTVAHSVKDSSTQVVASIESDFPVTDAIYTISGDRIPGGDEKQEGKAVITKINDHQYEATFLLQNIPSRLTKITIQVASGKNASGSCTGFLSVLRSRDASQIDDARKIYWLPQESVIYDAAASRYVLSDGSVFSGYANIAGPVKASFASPVPGLSLSTDGACISITADKDGLYRDIIVKVRDSQGVEYTAPSVTLLVDLQNPELTLTTPVPLQWAQTAVPLSVTATDKNGIASVEYSIDEGVTWVPCSAPVITPPPVIKGSKKDSAPAVLPSRDVYTALVQLEGHEDGLVCIDIRATDTAGRMSFISTAIQKDTTPPLVQVVVPGAQDVINGENRIAFIVHDSGKLVRAEYVAPPKDKKESIPVSLDLSPMITTLIGTSDQPVTDLMAFNFYDAAGNVTSIRKWDFIIDAQSDLPRAEVHLPEENAVITRDFVISGVVYDDDGPCKIWYKIDSGKYVALSDFNTSFSLDIPLSSLTDNEHSVTVYAEDIHGIIGPESVRKFRISLEEPKGKVETPPIGETVRGSVTITGSASDKNGISKVLVSLDNGNSYNESVGKFGHDVTSATWSYTFDTRIVHDGTHVVFVKIFDDYGIEGLYSSLITIDNTNPSISLELPLDDSKSSGMVFFSGQTTDNIGLTDLYITVRSLDGKSVSGKVSKTSLVPGEIIAQAIDLSSLDNGFYNVELTGSDAAHNITRVSRNIELNKNAPVAKVDLLYPLNGEHVQGLFNIYGTAVSEKPVTGLSLYVDGVQFAQTTLSATGYYKFQLTPELVKDGLHKIQVQAVLADSKIIASNEQYLLYQSVGPWVTIDNFTYGDFAIDRPFLNGSAGYAIGEDELVASHLKGASKDLKAAVASKSIDRVELSFDNGKSFRQVSRSGRWRYRIENGELPEGFHFILVRATMKNGEVAVTRTIVQVDKTQPKIKLISPGEGGRYNQQLVFNGLTNDDVALKSVVLALRKGDKSSYEVPSFIQGLYFDWQYWGATLYNLGLGLTFFGDNVKLQVQWGQFTQTQRNMFSQTNLRYGGDNILGAKILANVSYIPFRYYFGPDWEWLSANVAVGADFARFNETGSGKAQILSAMLAQVEFPRITFAHQKMFRTISFYTEGQLWFIPTDVSSSVDIDNMVPQVAVGLRVSVF